MRPSALFWIQTTNSLSAGKEWKHWIGTFENYLASFPERAQNEAAVNKLPLLNNSVAYDVYHFIDKCVTYEGVICALENLYIKTSNKIFFPSLAATAQQAPGQSLNDFV